MSDHISVLSDQNRDLVGHMSFQGRKLFASLYCTSTVSFVLYHCTFIRIYTSTAFFAFTRLDDSTHLRCYCTPTFSFILHHCTFLRIYTSTAHFAFTRLDDSTHLRCFCTPTVSFILHHCTFLRIYVSTAHFTS